MTKTYIKDFDSNSFIALLASSDGDVNLTAERFDALVGNERSATKDYEVNAVLSNLDNTTSDTLAGKLRTLLVVRLYNLISTATTQLMSDMGDLRPAELARTHASLTNTFATLTQGATKVTFDFEKEIRELAEEFEVPIEEVKGNLADMGVKKLRAL